MVMAVTATPGFVSVGKGLQWTGDRSRRWTVWAVGKSRLLLYLSKQAGGCQSPDSGTDNDGVIVGIGLGQWVLLFGASCLPLFFS